MNEHMHKVIELAVHQAEFNGMKYMANKITDEEYEAERERIINEVYTAMAQAEPTQESEVI